MKSICSTSLYECLNIKNLEAETMFHIENPFKQKSMEAQTVFMK